LSLIPKYFYDNYTSYLNEQPDYISNLGKNYYYLNFNYDNSSGIWNSDLINTSLVQNYNMSFKFKQTKNDNAYYILSNIIVLMYTSNCTIRIGYGSDVPHYIYANR
jgi:hypothetical protein